MNVKLTMAAIRKQSPLLNGMIAHGEGDLEGGVYDVRTGVVEFLDRPKPTRLVNPLALPSRGAPTQPREIP